MLYASFINFDRINSFILWFIWDTEIIQLTGESGNVATHWNTVCPPTLFSQSLMKLFKMVLMYGLLLMVNPNISWHNSNIKRSASNICYSTQQDQTSRVLAAIYHIHGLHAMPWMPLSFATHSIGLPSINQWTRTTLYSKPCVSETSGVYSMVAQRLSPRYACLHWN